VQLDLLSLLTVEELGKACQWHFTGMQQSNDTTVVDNIGGVVEPYEGVLVGSAMTATTAVEQHQEDPGKYPPHINFSLIHIRVWPVPRQPTRGQFGARSELRVIILFELSRLTPINDFTITDLAMQTR
jgi:hypothetical protein